MYLQRQLSKNFSGAIRQRGAQIYAWREVTLITGDRWHVAANVRGTSRYSVQLLREDDELHVLCTCPYFKSESACKHIWATIVAADVKNYLLGNSGGPIVLVEDDPRDDLDENGAETPLRRTAAAGPPKPPAMAAWRKVLQELNSGASRPIVSPGARRVEREIYYIIETQSSLSSRELCLRIENRERLQNGGWGKAKPLRIALISRVKSAIRWTGKS